jgi:hypothetical protein
LHPAKARTYDPCTGAEEIRHARNVRQRGPSGEVVARAPGARDGETPPAHLLTYQLPLARELARAERDNAGLWDQAPLAARRVLSGT